MNFVRNRNEMLRYAKEHADTDDQVLVYGPKDVATLMSPLFGPRRRAFCEVELLRNGRKNNVKTREPH